MRARTRPGDALPNPGTPSPTPGPLATVEAALARDAAAYRAAVVKLHEAIAVAPPLEDGPGDDAAMAGWADHVVVASRVVAVAAKTLRYSYRAVRGLRPKAPPVAPAPAAPKAPRGKGKVKP